LPNWAFSRSNRPRPPNLKKKGQLFDTFAKK
jgi:hypothetical protein